jgi:hypothetical protein
LPFEFNLQRYTAEDVLHKLLEKLPNYISGLPVMLGVVGLCTLESS